MAKDLLQLFGTDADAAEQGVWHTIKGLKVRIARWNNPAFQRALEREMEPHRDAVESDGLSEAEDRQIMARVISETVVTDWEGRWQYDGEELEYSPEAAERILSDPRMRDFRLEVTRRSQQADRYRIRHLDADRKNSPARSAGS